MIGLEYILDFYSITGTELASDLKIAKQNISRWLKGDRKIPEKYLSILESKFRIPREYIVKNIRKSDKLIIQVCKIQSENERITKKEIHECVEDFGNYIVEKEVYEPHIQKKIEELEYNFNRYIILEQIEDLIFAKTEKKHLYDNEDNIVNLYKWITDIYINKKANILVLFEIFEAIELSNIENNKELAKELSHEIKGFVTDMVFMLKKYKFDEKKGFNVLIKDHEDIVNYNELVREYNKREETVRNYSDET